MIDRELPFGNLPVGQAVTKFGAELESRGLVAGTAPYDGAIVRYKTQWKQLNELLPKYEKWANTVKEIGGSQGKKSRGKFKGVADLSWDATENPRNFSKVPEFNPTARTEVRFRLTRTNSAGLPDPHGRFVVPEIKPVGGDWGPITGDVDWLSFADAEGAQLDDAANISLLSDLGYYGAQHPESANWVLNGNFHAKIEYLSGYRSISELEAAGGIGKQTNFQFGPDGKIRTVVLDYNKSEFTSPTQTRLWWQGGIQTEVP